MFRPKDGDRERSNLRDGGAAQKKRWKPLLYLLGAPGGIRTPDPLLRRQLLFPLSYGRTPLSTETVP